MRFTAVGLLVAAGLLASCSAGHVRPGAQSRAGTQPQAGGRQVGTRAPAHPPSRSSVLAPDTVNRDGATQTYRADRPGQAVLVSDARGCLILRHPEARPVTTRTCPVATVTVVP